MANTKETPRKKMIGMMYLVLTALLALQVDNTLLDKFRLIDDSLKDSISETQSDNYQSLNNIQEAVKKRGNQKDGLTTVAKAKQIVIETQTVVKEIESLKKQLIQITGGVDNEGNYVGAKDTDKVMALALGPGDSKKGQGYKLQQLLDRYISNINTLKPGINLLPIALDASEIGHYKNTDQKGKDFVELNFENTPLVAALAILSQIETEVVNTESKALGLIATEVGAEEVPFDKIVAKASPESRIVTAGTPYRAKMYIAASSSAANPTMESSEGKVELTPDGEGLLEFTASANSYDASGQAKKTWKGSITIHTPKGDSTFQVEEEYVVVRPTIQFSSEATEALYRNCGNVINVQVPQLGNNFNPTFTAKGGEIIKSHTAGRATAIPRRQSMTIAVNNNGSYIGSKKFRVRPIPTPSIQLFEGTSALNLKDGGKAPRKIRVKAIPDKDFADFLPRDARYRVTKWKVYLASGQRRKGEKSIKGEHGNISELVRNARVGESLLIEINEVIRTNYKGEKEKVNIGKDIFFRYPITR